MVKDHSDSERGNPLPPHGLLFWINSKDFFLYAPSHTGAGRSSEVAHGAMGRRIDPSWGGPIELFLVPASAPRLV